MRFYWPLRYPDLIFVSLQVDWPKADVILLSLGHGEKLSVFDNILLGGYTDDKNQMVLVKVFGDSFDVTSKVLTLLHTYILPVMNLLPASSPCPGLPTLHTEYQNFSCLQGQISKAHTYEPYGCKNYYSQTWF